MDNIDGLLDSAKKKCKAKEREAMTLTNNSKPSEGSKFRYKQQFDQLPDSIDELLQQMDEIEGQIECMGADNQGVSLLINLNFISLLHGQLNYENNFYFFRVLKNMKIGWLKYMNYAKKLITQRILRNNWKRKCWKYTICGIHKLSKPLM